MIRKFHLLSFPLLALSLTAHAATHVYTALVLEEMRSSAITVKVNGQPVDIAHVAASYQIFRVDVAGPVDIEITAVKPGSRFARRQMSEMAEKRCWYSETGVLLS